MKRSRVLAAVVAALVVGLPTATAQADPNPYLHVDSVTLDKTSVAVSGLNTVPVKVTIKARYTDTTDPNLTLYAILEGKSTSGKQQVLLSTNLPLIAGSSTNGTWSGPLYVPSTVGGTLKVTSVFAGQYWPGSGDMTEPTPYAGPALAVTGTHVPKITAAVTPKVVPFGKPYTIRWAVTDSATGKPYGSRLRVMLANDNVCVEYMGPSYSNLTDTNGVVSKTYPASDAEFGNCLLLPGNPAAVGALAFFVARPTIIAAAPARTSAPVGTIVPVNGSVAGAPTCPINLQRLYGATQWRTVGTAQVRQSGRFTLNAQPAYKGQIPYRVSFPGCSPFGAAVTKAFYIRGT